MWIHRLYHNVYRSKKPTGRKKKNEAEKKKQILSESAMKLPDAEASNIILFDELKSEMSLPLLGIEDNVLAPSDEVPQHSLLDTLQNLANTLRNGEVPGPMHEMKVFLRMSAIKFHYLASHFSLIFHDKKCARNQVKRAYTVIPKSDLSSRLFIRLMLEVLRCGTFIESQRSTTESTPAEQEKQIKAIFQYIRTMMKTMFPQTAGFQFAPRLDEQRNSVIPFIALCTVYAYCSVDDAVIRRLKSNETENAEQRQNEQDVIRRRITFLRFMIGQLMMDRTPGSYLWAIMSVAVYLKKLMDRCNDYDANEKDKLDVFLKKWLPKQWEFVNDQFADCPPIKRATARVLKGFGLKMEQQEMDRVLRDNDEDKDFMLREDLTAAKKHVTNHFDHIYIKSNKK